MLIDSKLRENAKFYALISSLALVLIVFSLQVISHEEAKETIKYAAFMYETHRDIS